MPSCGHCGKSLPTSARVKQHISNTPACREKRDRQANQRIHALEQLLWLKRHQGGHAVEANTHADGNDIIPDDGLELAQAADMMPPFIPNPHHQRHEIAVPRDPTPPPDKRACVEEVEDDEASGIRRFVQVFPDDRAAEVLGMGETVFKQLQKHQEADGVGPFGPFADSEEWGLAQWLVKNVNQHATEEYLKLPITRERTKPSFGSNYTFLKAIDKLPAGPEWKCQLVTAEGDREGDDGEVPTEEPELWMRDPVECIHELISNPTFRDHLAYAPEKVFTDEQGEIRRFDEMWTGDWWWSMQERLPSGSTVAPIILASDKTELSHFKGDKSAWPVYITIGNIVKSVRRQPSKHTTALLGYIPVSKLASFEDNSVASYRLFHYCMRLLLEPLVKAGRDGVNMLCADGMIRRIFPILAAYKTDALNAWLSIIDEEKTCGHLNVAMEKLSKSFRGNGMDTDLPNTDIFACISSDILYQLHQGVFKDHFVKWCVKLVGKQAFDKHFQAMTNFSGLRHFSKGVSKVKQWTGTEHKEMQRILLGVLAGAVDVEIITCARVLLDFIYYSQYHSHTDNTLHSMQAALDDFHANKDIFIQLGIRDHFNIPKLHSMLHYLDTIRRLRALDGLNSENSERLHIDYAKKAYCASSRKDYMIQMARWLQRQEAVTWWNTFLQWRLGPAQHGIAAGVKNEAGCPPEDSDDEHPDEALISLTYSLAKRSPHPNTSISQLGRHHGAVCFLEALTQYLEQSDIPGHKYAPNQHDRFDLFKYMYVYLPETPHFSDSKRHMRVRTAPERSNGPRKPPTPARFDTVLIVEDEDARRLGGLNGLCAAEVRVIFTLPPHLGSSAHPLAYVHFFRPLRTWDDDLKMYHIGRCHAPKVFGSENMDY
ncbi:hypothetical protein BV22DRAFT_1135543 [Leucogyrophana mollusca]|uniref:Uncharacterized protein n=1 Tax=Leucogyrophana mollusca TaxID=85980 RepID=A0ACB8AW47_9AGAM|nr:hypothetical protein BV22DRAFT_1135543 [Leucogyrophana mollusca]